MQATETCVKERPIIFNAEMVRAIQDDRKTQTRRIIKPKEFGPSDTKGYDWNFRDKRMLWNDVSTKYILDRCPYGIPGDRLWVRETWCLDYQGDRYHYKADGHDINLYTYEGVLVPGRSPWKPSIHMPRSLSRITLEITNVRVEMVQDISLDDCIAEGVGGNFKLGTYDPQEPCPEPDELFSDLWDSINAKKGFGWDVNPGVRVIEFKRLAEV